MEIWESFLESSLAVKQGIIYFHSLQVPNSPANNKCNSTHTGSRLELWYNWWMRLKKPHPFWFASNLQYRKETSGSSGNQQLLQKRVEMQALKDVLARYSVLKSYPSISKRFMQKQQLSMTIRASGEQGKRHLRTQIHKKYADNYRFQYNEKKEKTWS